MEVWWNANNTPYDWELCFTKVQANAERYSFSQANVSPLPLQTSRKITIHDLILMSSMYSTEAKFKSGYEVLCSRGRGNSGGVAETYRLQSKAMKLLHVVGTLYHSVTSKDTFLDPQSRSMHA